MSSTPSLPAANVPQIASRPFLGWRVIGAAFTAQFLSSAATFSSFGLFIIPLTQSFDVARGSLNYAFSIAFLVMGVSGPFVGVLLDRGYTRSLMVLGALISGLALFALARAESVLELGLFFCGGVALGAALFGPGPSMALAANWFVRKRGLALGLTVAGATFASFLAPLAVAWMIDEIGWRGACSALGAGVIVIGVPVFSWLVVARPEAVGQRPDGDPDIESQGEAATLDTSALLRDPRLWVLALGFGLVFSSPVVLMPTLVPYAEDLGFSRQSAALFFTAMAPFSLLGKVAFGALADRIPPRLAIWTVVLGNIAVWGLLATEPAYWLFLATGAIYGLGIGATAPLQGVILGRCFGRVAFGRASGIGGLATIPLVAAAPAVAGYLLDSSGSYQGVFTMEGGLLLLGGALLTLVRIPASD